jgi:hypothetical protein
MSRLQRRGSRYSVQHIHKFKNGLEMVYRYYRFLRSVTIYFVDLAPTFQKHMSLDPHDRRLRLCHPFASFRPLQPFRTQGIAEQILQNFSHMLGQGKQY